MTLWLFFNFFANSFNFLAKSNYLPTHGRKRCHNFLKFQKVLGCRHEGPVLNRRGSTAHTVGGIEMNESLIKFEPMHLQFSFCCCETEFVQLWENSLRPFPKGWVIVGLWIYLVLLSAPCPAGHGLLSSLELLEMQFKFFRCLHHLVQSALV